MSMSDSLDMEEIGRRHHVLPRASPSREPNGSADGTESFVTQYSIDAAIQEDANQWVGKWARQQSGKSAAGLLVDINHDVFKLLQVSGGRQSDHLELQALMDIFHPEQLLYDTKNFNSSIPSHLSLQELSARQRLMAQYLTFDLPEVHNPSIQKLRPFDLTPAERRKAQIVMRVQEKTLMDAYNNASAEERHVLGDAYGFCDLVNGLIIDPTLLEGAYEDLFCAFCKLANLNLSQGKSYDKKATVLGKEVTAVPGFRILRKECFLRKAAPFTKHPGLVAVVEVKGQCQWDYGYDLPRNLRPRGDEYTCNMLGQLLGDMLLHLDISCCIAKPDDEELEAVTADRLAIIGISVVTTKVCFCVLEMSREQYNAIMVADKQEAYQYHIRMDEIRKKGISPAVVRYTDCLDMACREDRPELLKVLHMIGNMG